MEIYKLYTRYGANISSNHSSQLKLTAVQR